MSNELCFLVTILYEGGLIQCAIKFDANECDMAPERIGWEFMEPDCIEFISGILPDHVRSCGPIVDVAPMFEVHCHVEPTDIERQVFEDFHGERGHI